MIHISKTNTAFFALILTCLMLGLAVNVSFAKPISDAADRAKFGKAQSLTNLDQTDEALVILEDLYRRYPDNGDVLSEYLRAVTKTKGIKEAQVFLTRISNTYRVDEHEPATTVQVIIMLGSVQLHDLAIEFCHKLIAYAPGYKDVHLWHARVLSWAQKFEEAITEYDQLIDRDPDNLLYAREKARVLGWMQDYRGALNTYDDAYLLSGSDVVYLEMKAKENFYKFYDLKAAEYYEQWLGVEPDNLEALFDLAQVYSRLKEWDKAQLNYEKVLAVASHHPLAGAAYKKLNVLKDSKSLRLGARYHEADSSSRVTDNRHFSIFETLTFPVNDQLKISVGHTDHLHEFADLSAVQRHTGEIGFDLNLNPKLVVQGGYIYSDYSDGVDDSHNAFASVKFKPTDLFDVNVSYKREDVIDGRTSLVNEIDRDVVRVRANAFLHRRIELGGDYSFADYSDDNEKHTYGTDLALHLLYAPTRLTVRYRYENYGFDKTSANYFSPSSFHFNEVGIEWQHFLNKSSLFWGSRDTYYMLGYAVSFDVGDQSGHRVYLQAYKDWTDRFATKIEWSKKFYEHDKIYDDETLMLIAVYYF